MQRNPVLFLIPTPIGNMRDITLRALDVLKGVDLIACEDTRHTRKLLAAYDIHKPLVSYEKFSEMKKVVSLIDRLLSGESIALVSSAGTPLVSDPGTALVSRARENGIRVEALPGPCAAITAISASGFEGPFRFIGFFPRRKALAKREVGRMLLSSEHTVFYESPQRILNTLKFLDEGLGSRVVCLAREISKLHEEYLLGSSREVMGRLEGREAIGEVTVIVRGASGEDSLDDLDEDAVRDRALTLIHSGYSKKDALRTLSDETGMGRNRIYELLLGLD